MEATLLRELLAAYIPPEETDAALITAVQLHLELLLRWNQKMNLTGLRSPEQIVQRHFGESLFAARHLLTRASAEEVCDVGSGAGFPGLPLKYWSPQLRLTLIEGHGKKATFLREVTRTVGLGEVSVLNLRAEAVNVQASLVTLRAVERFDQVLPSAAALVAPGGRLALLIGEAQCEQARSLLPKGTTESFDLPASERRVLLVWRQAV